MLLNRSMTGVAQKIKGIRSGLWKTDGGSALHLTINDDQVTGTYATIHGQPEPGLAFPIIGFVNDELIGFVCSWGEHKSMTSWCGRYGICEETKRECIRTTWHLGRQFADRAHTQENEFWESFVTFTGIYYIVEE